MRSRSSAGSCEKSMISRNSSKSQSPMMADLPVARNCAYPRETVYTVFLFFICFLVFFNFLLMLYIIHMLVVARKLTTSREMLLWMTPSEAPKALQASECSELLDPMRASCWISAQH